MTDNTQIQAYHDLFYEARRRFSEVYLTIQAEARRDKQDPSIVLPTIAHALIGLAAFITLSSGGDDDEFQDIVDDILKDTHDFLRANPKPKYKGGH